MRQSTGQQSAEHTAALMMSDERSDPIPILLLLL
jgi:hypothetical protein